MKRIPPKDLKLMPKRFESDPKKAYTKKQLAEIAAISLVWNQIEAQIDYLSSHIVLMGCPFFVQIEASKIIGFSGKLKLLYACAKNAQILDESAKRCIEIILDAIPEVRKHRNAVVHHHIYDHKKGIASYIDESGKPYQILVTYQALAALYERLSILRNELIQAASLFSMELLPPGNIRVMNPETGVPERDQPKALRERAVPEATARVLHYQQKRLSLPPLPLFPDARRVRPKTEAVKTRHRSLEKGRKK